MRLVQAFAFSLLLGATACGGGMGSSYTTSPGPYTGPGPGPAPSSRTNSPIMSGAAFSPVIDTVAVGSTVTWTNHDGINHTVTSVSGSPETFTSGLVAGGTSFSHTFSTAGTYVYYCQIHGSPTGGMQGTMVVQ